MSQFFESLIRVDFFKGAQPEAAFWGRIGLGVGLAGLAASIVFALMHLRDQISLTHGQRNPILFRPPKWGPLSHSLGAFFADPVHSAPLSPDAAAEFVIGRLEATRDATASVIRYFSYAPLLFGLMGTIFALRALLVVQGNTLQQIEPHLAGVFAGTLAGIVGSLLASFGGLMLDWTSLMTINRAQDFVHRHILPILPERRIAVRIEDAILALIGEKAQAVAQSFGKSMEPVAAQLEQVAKRCAQAADAATKALTEAARAVREAGNLEVATRDFKIGAHMIDSSAEQLSDATKQTAEVILRVGEIRQSLGELLARIQETAENLGSTSARLAADLGSKVAELNASSATLQATVQTLHPAIETLSAELKRRAGADSAHLEVIRGHVETTSKSFATVQGVLKESSDELKTIPVRIEAIAGSLADSTRHGISTGMERVTGDLGQKLESVVLALEHSAAALVNSASQARSAGADGSPTFESGKSIRQAAEELRKASEEIRRLGTALQQLLQSSSNAAARKPDGLIRWLLNR